MILAVSCDPSRHSGMRPTTTADEAAHVVHGGATVGARVVSLLSWRQICPIAIRRKEGSESSIEYGNMLSWRNKYHFFLEIKTKARGRM